jgi:hypothetical protein
MWFQRLESPVELGREREAGVEQNHRDVADVRVITLPPNF